MEEPDYKTIGINIKIKRIRPVSYTHLDVYKRQLQAVSKKVETKEAKAQVASISAADEEIGGLIADAMEKVGDDGVITGLLYTSSSKVQTAST